MTEAEQDGEAAYTLLKLLGIYCQCQDEWEAHYDCIFAKTYKPGEEAREYARLSREFTNPLIEQCKMAGFRHGHLMEIIPGNFGTNSKDRARQLKGLRTWVWKTYELELPF